jgi:hypothetical protein
LPALPDTPPPNAAATLPPPNTAPRIVLAQLEGSGRGALAAYNQAGYFALSRQLQEVSLRDPHAWMDDLVRKDKGIGVWGCGGRGKGGGPCCGVCVWGGCSEVCARKHQPTYSLALSALCCPAASSVLCHAVCLPPPPPPTTTALRMMEVRAPHHGACMMHPRTLFECPAVCCPAVLCHAVRCPPQQSCT